MFLWILFGLIGFLPSTALAAYGSVAFDNPRNITVDVKRLSPRHLLTIDWNGHGVIIYRRTEADIQHLKKNFEELADPYGNNLGTGLSTAARSWGNAFASLAKPFNEHLALDPLRSVRPEIVVLSIASGYSGCAVSYRRKGDKSMGRTWPGGFYDPCRDVRFDLSGRVLRGHQHPVNLNLLAIPHSYDSAGNLIIGLRGELPPRIDFRPFIDYRPLTPDQQLLAASEYGELKKVQLAARAGANINARNKDGFTALLMALLEESYPVSRWLLENGADPNLKGTNHFSPACLAAVMRNEKLIRLLGEFKTNWEPRNPTHTNCEMPALISVITNAADEQDALRLVKALVEAGASPHVTYLGKSAVHYAQQAKYGKVSAYLKVITRRTNPAP